MFPFLTSWEGLLYNGPALLLLAYLTWKRPPLGLAIAALAYARVIEHVVPFSVHACLSGAALCALPRWERVWGAGLAVFTAYWYLGLWNEPESFWTGLGVGVLLGGISAVINYTLNRMKLPDVE